MIDAIMALPAVQVDDSANQVFEVDEHGARVMDYEMRNDLMATLSRGAEGCTEDKAFVLIIGPRNSGKGVLADSSRRLSARATSQASRRPACCVTRG